MNSIEKFIEKNKINNKYFIYILLGISIIITRLCFMTKYLFEWDSVQLALGIENFNIIQHQPHPPGYFLYIYFGKLIDIFIKNPNYSLIIINIIFTFIAVIIFYKIFLIVFKNKTLSLLSSFIFITNPFIWFHGEFVNIYTIDILFALIYFYLSILIIKSNKKQLMLLFSLLFGIGIGFRQSLLIFFLPLYLFTAYYYFKNLSSHLQKGGGGKKQYIKEIILNLIILIFSTLLWLIPSIYLTGSLTKFINIIKNQYNVATTETSILSFSKIINIIKQSFNTIKLLFYSSGILSIFIIYYFLKGKLKFGKKLKTIFIIWFWPSFLFYCLIHLGKAGYVMTILPLLLIIGIISINKIKSPIKKTSIFFLIIIFQTVYFLFNVEIQKNNFIINKLSINVAPYQINAVNLKNNDIRIDKIINEIKKYDSKDTILIAEADSPYILPRTNFIKSVRHLNYYLSEYFVYYLFNDKTKFTRYYRYQYNDRKLLYQSYIPIDNQIKNVILVTDDYNYDIYKFEDLNQYSEKKLFYKNISDIDEFEYIGYNFVKQ